MVGKWELKYPHSYESAHEARSKWQQVFWSNIYDPLFESEGISETERGQQDHFVRNPGVFQSLSEEEEDVFRVSIARVYARHHYKQCFSSNSLHPCPSSMEDPRSYSQSPNMWMSTLQIQPLTFFPVRPHPSCYPLTTILILSYSRLGRHLLTSHHKSVVSPTPCPNPSHHIIISQRNV